MHKIPEEWLSDPDRFGGRSVKIIAMGVRGWKCTIYHLIYYPRERALRAVPTWFSALQMAVGSGFGIWWLVDNETIAIGEDVFSEDVENKSPGNDLSFRLISSGGERK